MLYVVSLGICISFIIALSIYMHVLRNRQRKTEEATRYSLLQVKYLDWMEKLVIHNYDFEAYFRDHNLTNVGILYRSHTMNRLLQLVNHKERYITTILTYGFSPMETELRRIRLTEEDVTDINTLIFIPFDAYASLVDPAQGINFVPKDVTLVSMDELLTDIEDRGTLKDET